MPVKPVEPIKQRNQELILSNKYQTLDSELRPLTHKRDISVTDLPGVKMLHQTTENNASVKPNQERLQLHVPRKVNGADNARVLSSTVSECSEVRSQLLMIC